MKIIVVSFGSSSKRYHYYLDPKGASVKIGWTLHKVMGTTRYKAFCSDIKVIDIYETEKIPDQVKTMLSVGMKYTYNTSELPILIIKQKEINQTEEMRKNGITLKTKEEYISEAKARGIQFLNRSFEDMCYEVYCQEEILKSKKY